MDDVPDYPNVASADEPFVNVNLGSQLALNGRTIATCNTDPVGDRDSKVTFNFDGGGLLWFTCVGDLTSVEHSGLGHRGT